MNCSSNLKLMTLSSTIKTLIGGTCPSSNPVGVSFGGGGSPLIDLADRCCDVLFFLVDRPGCGELVLFGGVMLGR